MAYPHHMVLTRANGHFNRSRGDVHTLKQLLVYGMCNSVQVCRCMLAGSEIVAYACRKPTPHTIFRAGHEGVRIILVRCELLYLPAIASENPVAGKPIGSPADCTCVYIFMCMHRKRARLAQLDVINAQTRQVWKNEPGLVRSMHKQGKYGRTRRYLVWTRTSESLAHDMAT